MSQPTTLTGRPDVAGAAEVLDRAARDACPVPQFSAADTLDLGWGYAVQSELIERRIARGDRPTGIKLGFTSQAKMAQMGVHEIILGRLTRQLMIPDGGTLDVATLIHPRVEPEIAFRVSRDLRPDEPGSTASETFDAVAPALEVIDSRYRDFRFSLADVVADNTSAAGYVIGPWTRLNGQDLSNRGVLLEIDGRVAETGSTAAILGHPHRALTQALTLARRLHIAVRAGDVLLAGAATAAVSLRDGAVVRAVVAGLSTATLRTGKVVP